MALQKPYLDVPGTTIFDAEQSRKGYHLARRAQSSRSPHCPTSDTWSRSPSGDCWETAPGRRSKAMHSRRRAPNPGCRPQCRSGRTPCTV